jgi:hypothetical protein
MIAKLERCVWSQVRIQSIAHQPTTLLEAVQEHPCARHVLLDKAVLVSQSHLLHVLLVSIHLLAMPFVMNVLLACTARQPQARHFCVPREHTAVVAAQDATPVPLERCVLIHQSVLKIVILASIHCTRTAQSVRHAQLDGLARMSMGLGGLCVRMERIALEKRLSAPIALLDTFVLPLNQTLRFLAHQEPLLQLGRHHATHAQLERNAQLERQTQPVVQLGRIPLDVQHLAPSVLQDISAILRPPHRRHIAPMDTTAI